MGFRAFQAFADPARSGELHSNGTWRSPVAHLNGVQGVAGSNPAVPIAWYHRSRALCSEEISAQRRDPLGHKAFSC
jgi:hypothetical protein